ncbi:MAG TPA: hypothetical protein ENN22_06490 [bacterium]|nr:hypothetical protein [bacterium]
MASSLYGEPRPTYDIDIIINCSPVQLKNFVQSFPQDRFYADIEMANDAFQNRSMFNIIDLESGWKADFIILKSDDFSQTEFSRKKQYKILGLELSVMSAEDTILSKLLWSKMGESERQFRDALGVFILQKQKLDIEYLTSWAKKLEIDQLFGKMIEQANKLDE